jgi:hypothetical protein
MGKEFVCGATGEKSNWLGNERYGDEFQTDVYFEITFADRMYENAVKESKGV